MKTRQFLKRRAFFPSIVAMLLGMGLFMLVAPGGVRADSLATFNFSGTLANPGEPPATKVMPSVRRSASEWKRSSDG
jgi:hypothetical protein